MFHFYMQQLFCLDIPRRHDDYDNQPHTVWFELHDNQYEKCDKQTCVSLFITSKCHINEFTLVSAFPYICFWWLMK